MSASVLASGSGVRRLGVVCRAVQRCALNLDLLVDSVERAVRVVRVGGGVYGGGGGEGAVRTVGEPGHGEFSNADGEDPVGGVEDRGNVYLVRWWWSWRGVRVKGEGGGERTGLEGWLWGLQLDDGESWVKLFVDETKCGVKRGSREHVEVVPAGQ